MKTRKVSRLMLSSSLIAFWSLSCACEEMDPGLNDTVIELVMKCPSVKRFINQVLIGYNVVLARSVEGGRIVYVEEVGNYTNRLTPAIRLKLCDDGKILRATLNPETLEAQWIEEYDPKGVNLTKVQLDGPQKSAQLSKYFQKSLTPIQKYRQLFEKHWQMMLTGIDGERIYGEIFHANGLRVETESSISIKIKNNGRISEYDLDQTTGDGKWVSVGKSKEKWPIGLIGPTFSHSKNDKTYFDIGVRQNKTEVEKKAGTVTLDRDKFDLCFQLKKKVDLRLNLSVHSINYERIRIGWWPEDINAFRNSGLAKSKDQNKRSMLFLTKDACHFLPFGNEQNISKYDGIEEIGGKWICCKTVDSFVVRADKKYFPVKELPYNDIFVVAVYPHVGNPDEPLRGAKVVLLKLHFKEE